jgi:hypothetical protein
LGVTGLQGYRVTGYRVTGYRVTGLQVTGYRVTGYRLQGYRLQVTGYRLQIKLLDIFSSLVVTQLDVFVTIHTTLRGAI